jgi:hypothetical protein
MLGQYIRWKVVKSVHIKVRTPREDVTQYHRIRRMNSELESKSEKPNRLTTPSVRGPPEGFKLKKQHREEMSFIPFILHYPATHQPI